MMDQLRTLISSLSLRQRITIVLAAVLAVAVMMGLTHWRKESDFKPLYTALAPEDAALVVQKLKEAGSEYRISESGTAVLAPSGRVPELRLELAGAGLPRTGRIGYELFDKTNLGATDFTEQLNYYRALEGELERSIGAISSVEQARVHLTFPKDSVFLESRQPAKASVLLKLRPGAQTTPQNVSAVTNLVASAVEGLSPDAVSVLDMRGNLLSRPRHGLGADEPSEATLEYRQKVEGDLVAKVNSTLEPLLGSDKFRAGVSVDCDFTSGEQSEETLDPNKSVMLTSQKTEEVSGSSLAAGQPGTASNLPRPASRPGNGGSGLSRKTENIQYQTSRVVRHVKLAQGLLKRMSISILVDYTTQTTGSGPKARKTVTPPSAETLKAIHDLVAAATGFSTERGDQLVIESLPFEMTRDSDLSMPAPEPKPVDTRVPQPLRPWFHTFSELLIAVAGAAGLIILLGTSVMLLVGRKKSRKAGSSQAIAASAPKHDVAVKGVGPSLESAETDSSSSPALAETRQVPIITTKKADAIIVKVRDSIAKDSQGTTNVLRTWLVEPAKSGK